MRHKSSTPDSVLPLAMTVQFTLTRTMRKSVALMFGKQGYASARLCQRWWREQIQQNLDLLRYHARAVRELEKERAQRQ